MLIIKLIPHIFIKVSFFVFNEIYHQQAIKNTPIIISIIEYKYIKILHIIVEIWCSSIFHII